VHHAAGPLSLPDYALLTFAGAGLVLFVRCLLTRKPVDSALLWSLTAYFLSLHFTESVRISTTYSAVAACILASSIIENSYLLAYHDELTTLPSRRAFNDALLRLQEPYSIAMVDIDHFKRFNDTYGHDTGDQVLRLVASSLARVTGGGQAYRCGGEEFAILFPGKTTSDVVSHLEQLRTTIETSEFRMRSTDRRQVPRGPDRRTQKTRGRARKADAIRHLAKDKPSASLSVTVSIGVATSSEERPHTDLVLQAADKALYCAKDNGRNRVETASAKRGRAKTVEIA
jgi:diguanylate cyclase (GGDEF)-like protein